MTARILLALVAVLPVLLSAQGLDPNTLTLFNRGKTRADTAPPYPSDDGMLLNQLPKWVPDAATRRKILVENPARLYGFGGA